MIIVQDTREHLPWDFSFYDAEVIAEKIDTGDYSIKGMEDIICIERKKSTAEIAVNFGVDFKRFEKELERMADFKYKFLFFEFSIADVLSFPINSGIPKDKIKGLRISSKYLVKQLEMCENKYGIEIVYCNDRDTAIDYAYATLKDIYEKEYKESN